MTRTAQENSIVDELTFRNYAHNRMLSPHITPEQWALIYSNVPEMEERYKLASTGNILDVADQGKANPRIDSLCVGDEGSVGNLEKSESTRCAALLIERLTDSVIRAEQHAAEIEQYRAEEEAAAEEGALIEASGYLDPVYERNGR